MWAIKSDVAKDVPILKQMSVTQRFHVFKQNYTLQGDRSSPKWHPMTSKWHNCQNSHYADSHVTDHQTETDIPRHYQTEWEGRRRVTVNYRRENRIRDHERLQIWSRFVLKSINRSILWSPISIACGRFSKNWIPTFKLYTISLISTYKCMNEFIDAKYVAIFFNKDHSVGRYY